MSANEHTHTLHITDIRSCETRSHMDVNKIHVCHVTLELVPVKTITQTQIYLNSQTGNGPNN